MHRPFTPLAALLAVGLVLAGPALADGKGHGNRHGHDGHTPKAFGLHCPPGLAKKNPPCVPPGQAKKMYGPGDRITHDYILIRDPWRYGLDDGTYYRVGDYVYRVDRDTREVLDLIGAVARVLD